MKTNLISVSKLCQDYKIEFFKDMCYIIDPNQNKVIANAKLDNDNLFNFYDFSKSRSSLFSSIDFNVWHERLGHINANSIAFMQNSKMVDGLPAFSSSKIVCTGCMSGKMHREPFPQGQSWRATTKLHLVHSDLLGPMEHNSIQGSRYALTFVDDFLEEHGFISFIVKINFLISFVNFINLLKGNLVLRSKYLELIMEKNMSIILSIVI